MSSFTFLDQTKLITNMNTNKFPSELKDIFIDLWKLVQVGSGKLTVKLVDGKSGTKDRIIFKMQRAGESEKFIAKKNLNHLEASKMRDNLNYRRHLISNSVKLEHSECNRIEKVSWIGLRTIDPLPPIHIIVANSKSLELTFRDLETKRIEIWGNLTTISPFYIEEGMREIKKNSPVIVNKDGFIEGDPILPSSGILGTAMEVLKKGQAIKGETLETKWIEFHRWNSPMFEKPQPEYTKPEHMKPITLNEKMKQPEIIKKKNLTITSIDSIRDKLRG